MTTSMQVHNDALGIWHFFVESTVPVFYVPTKFAQQLCRVIFDPNSPSFFFFFFFDYSLLPLAKGSKYPAHEYVCCDSVEKFAAPLKSQSQGKWKFGIQMTCIEGGRSSWLAVHILEPSFCLKMSNLVLPQTLINHLGKLKLVLKLVGMQPLVCPWDGREQRGTVCPFEIRSVVHKILVGRKCGKENTNKQTK